MYVHANTVSETAGGTNVCYKMRKLVKYRFISEHISIDVVIGSLATLNSSIFNNLIRFQPDIQRITNSSKAICIGIHTYRFVMIHSAIYGN